MYFQDSNVQFHFKWRTDKNQAVSSSSSCLQLYILNLITKHNRIHEHHHHSLHDAADAVCPIAIGNYIL